MARLFPDIPRDVLIEIFLECLPSSPLQHRQPDVTLAPMLLCQVCAYWRQVALSAPQLWAYLSHTATVVRRIADGKEGNDIRAKDVQFMRWWSRNLGQMSPILRPRFFWAQNEVERAETKTECPKAFLRTLLSPAKYLDLNQTYISTLHLWTDSSPWVYPNLDTLVLRSSSSSSPLRNRAIPMDHTHTPPLRRIHLEGFTFNTQSALAAFPRANLTHVNLLSLIIPLATWFHLIRSLTSLVSGTFQFTSLAAPTAMHSLQAEIRPATTTLPHLRTLHLSLPASQQLDPEMEVRRVLLALELPSLRRLRITSPALSLASLNALLSSTPAVTQLHLCGCVPFAWAPPPPPPPSSVPNLPHAASPLHDGAQNPTPLCDLLPRLRSVLLDGSAMNNATLPLWARGILTSEWLGLTAPRPATRSLGKISVVQIAVHPITANAEGSVRYRTRRLSAPGAGTVYLLNGSADMTVHANANVNNGWVGSHPGFSRDRSSYVLNKLKGVVDSCGFAEGVRVVVRGEEEVMLCPGDRLEEEEHPVFDVLGFEEEEEGDV